MVLPDSDSNLKPYRTQAYAFNPDKQVVGLGTSLFTLTLLRPSLLLSLPHRFTGG